MALTTDDVKFLMDTFATKEDLTRIEKEVRADMVTKVEFNQALGKLYYLIGELKTIRQEQVFGNQRFEDLEEDRDSLNKRVKKIEVLPSISSQIK